MKIYTNMYEVKTVCRMQEIIAALFLLFSYSPLIKFLIDLVPTKISLLYGIS